MAVTAAGCFRMNHLPAKAALPVTRNPPHSAANSTHTTMNKPARNLLLAAFALLTAASATAQVADLIIVEKLGNYTQTSASAPSLTNYRFDVAVQNLGGADLSGITAPTVGLAAGSTHPTADSTTHNGGTLVYNDGEWRYGSPNGWGVSTAGNGSGLTSLNTLFANGATTVTVQGNTYTLDTDGAANNQAFMVPVVPTLTFSGGLWSGGKYVIDVSQTLTIATNNWTGFSTAGIGGFMEVGLDGLPIGVTDATRVFSRLAPTSFAGDINESALNATFIVAANTLTAGQDYEGFSTFARMVSQDTSQAGMFAIAWWANETSFTISAVPEPSTYALLAGVAALGLAAWRRRKTTA